MDARIVEEVLLFAISRGMTRTFSVPLPLKNREQQNATAAQTKRDLFAVALLQLGVNEHCSAMSETRDPTNLAKKCQVRFAKRRTSRSRRA